MSEEKAKKRIIKERGMIDGPHGPKPTESSGQESGRDPVSSFVSKTCLNNLCFIWFDTLVYE